jgi:hypothetical protein
MFEKLNRAAELAARRLSRRMFLGGFGRGALAAAAAAMGILAVTAEATAAACPSGWIRSKCRGRGGASKSLCCPLGYHCQPYRQGYICCPDGMFCN